MDATAIIHAAIQPTAGGVSYDVCVICQTVTMFKVAEKRVMIHLTYAAAIYCFLNLLPLFAFKTYDSNEIVLCRLRCEKLNTNMQRTVVYKHILRIFFRLSLCVSRTILE